MPSKPAPISGWMIGCSSPDAARVRSMAAYERSAMPVHAPFAPEFSSPARKSAWYDAGVARLANVLPAKL